MSLYVMKNLCYTINDYLLKINYFMRLICLEECLENKFYKIKKLGHTIVRNMNQD